MDHHERARASGLLTAMRLHYPKLAVLLLSFAMAYMLYHAGFFDVVDGALDGAGYVSVLIAGLLFSFGFTSPFAIAILAERAEHVSLWIAVPLAGIGAMAADMVIFTFIRLSFRDEFERLAHTSIAHRIYMLLHPERLSQRVRKYLLWSMAGLIIASPLPDELGVTLLGGLTNIDKRKFTAISLAFNMAGILAILLAARFAG